MDLRRIYRGCFTFGCIYSLSALLLALCNYYLPAAIMVVVGACLVWSAVIIQRLYIEEVSKNETP